MKIHVFHTGEVRVSPYLPFGGDNCNLLKASGMTTPKKDWMWLPVTCAPLSGTVMKVPSASHSTCLATVRW